MKKEQERYIIDESGNKTDVVIPVDEYEELMEDLHDLAIIAERRDENTIDFNELKKRLTVPASRGLPRLRQNLILKKRLPSMSW